MKNLALFAVAILVSFGAVALSDGAEPAMPKPDASAPVASSTDVGKIQGQVLKIDGESYLIKDAIGNETRLNVDKGTTIKGSPKVGDKIEAELSADGHVLSLNAAQ